MINLEPIIAKYSADNNVAGLLLFGSASAGLNDQYSDVDIYVVTTKPGKISREQFKTGDQIYDVLFDSADEIKDLISEEKFHVKRNVSLMIGSAQVIFDRSGQMDQLVQLAKDCLAIKATYSDSEILMYRYSIEDFLSDAVRDFECQNWTGFYTNAGFVLQNCIEVLLKTAGGYFKKPSELEAQLNNLDPAFSMLLSQFYELSDKSEQLEVLKKLAAHCLEKVGGPLPESWQA